MARAELVTPVCEATNLPLPIIPIESAPRPRGVFKFNDHINRPPNRHHAFHPNSSPVLADSKGRALRDSRIQVSRIALHDQYHQLFKGPPLPETEEEMFQSVVFSVAGIVPREGIEMLPYGGYAQREMTPNEQAKLARPGVMKFENTKRIGRFISTYILEQNVAEIIEENHIEEFLDNKTTQERKRELASFILGETLDLSLEGLAPTHRQFKEQGLVVDKRSKTLRHLTKKIVRATAFSFYSERLYDRLAYD